MEIVWKPRLKSAPLTSNFNTADMPELMLKVLASRGISSEEEVQRWLQPKLSELRDPYSLSQMKKAALRLVEAFKKDQSIAIYGDFDLDGTSGIALFSTALEGLGFKKVQLYQPSRLTEGYGLHVAAVDKLKSEGVELIVTVDVGITATAAAKHCKELGIDLIITDHHLAQDEIPDCFALVNPNIESEKPAGLGHLCGAGVAFYLAWAVKREMVLAGFANEKDFDLKDVLDCFVIGTLTDMVPIIAENRVLVKYGLQKLAATKRPGLRVLLQELGLWGRPLNGSDVAIRFAPKLNALSRMELGIRPLDIFLAKDEAKAQELVVGVLNNNSIRVNLQAEAESLALEMAKSQLENPFIFICDERFHRGVVGLIATRLCQTFQKPAFVGSLGEDGQVVGSARAPQTGYFNLVEALDYGNENFLRFGGHALASGFEFEISKKAAIEEKLKAYYLQAPKNGSVKVELVYDAEAGLKELSSSFMGWLDRLGPYGHSFDAPVFLIKNIEVSDFRILKGGHRRLKIKGGVSEVYSSKQQQEALLFSPSPSQIEILERQSQVKSQVDVLAELQWNYFQGRKTVQILIKEIRES